MIYRHPLKILSLIRLRSRSKFIIYHIHCYSLGESIGIVMMPKDHTEMRGGKFMRVRVTIDVSEPLCRGRLLCMKDYLTYVTGVDD